MTTRSPDSSEIGTAFASNEVAEHWHRSKAQRDKVNAAANEMMLDLANLRPGNRVLDVAAGTGDQTLMAARHRHSHVTFEIGDAQELPYDRGAFDCCVSSLMIQFILDAHAAAREMRRVTKRAEVLQLVYGTTVEAWSYRKDSGTRPLQLTRELNDVGIGVMDQQARFQICGLPLVLRMLKQRHWLFL